MRSAAWLITALLAGRAGGDVPRALAGASPVGAAASAWQSPAAQTAPPPDLRAFPMAPAPADLATTVFPETADAISALIEWLPPAVAGHQRSPQLDLLRPERVVIGYGDDRRIPGVPNPYVRLQVIDLGVGDFFPTSWTGGQVVGYLAQARAAKDAGRDGDLLWLRDETPVNVPGSTGQFIYGVMWGRIDSPWLFSVQGDTRESRDALLMAVVAAARSASGR
jgi:hypothetical protein